MKKTFLSLAAIAALIGSSFALQGADTSACCCGPDCTDCENCTCCCVAE